MSREDAASLLDLIHKQTAKDNRTHNCLYAKCRLGEPNTAERQASSNELMHDIITGLSLKLDFLQTFLIEQMFAKCTYLINQFMKDYGVLMEAAVHEVQNTISFFKSGLEAMLSALIALTSEKNLYAQKALALAKGFVASSSHSFDMMHIQPNFGYLDVISDICFKSGADVNSVLEHLYDMHQSVNGTSQVDSKTPWNVDVYVNHVENKTIRSTGGALGFIDSIYNQQLLTALSIDVRKAIAEIKKCEWGDDEGDVEEGKEEKGEEMKATALTSNIKLKVEYPFREEAARQIQRFVFICWISKRRRRLKQVLLVQQFLMAAVLRRRALALLLKQRKVARSKLIICRTICSYIDLCKRRAKAAAVIRSNIGKLYRNYFFREVSAACRKGAHRLIQREWALRHSDIDLRLLRIETYLSESSREGNNVFTICPRPTIPSAMYDAYESEHSWEKLSHYSREELLNCNIHILSVSEIDEELSGINTTSSTTAQSLHVLENTCRVHDVDKRAWKRYNGGKKTQDIRKKDSKPLKQGNKFRRATVDDVEGGFLGRRGSVSGGPHQPPPKRPGRRHSKVSTEGTKAQLGCAVVTEPECDRNNDGGRFHPQATPVDFKFEGQSLQAQLDTIKKSLEHIHHPLEDN